MNQVHLNPEFIQNCVRSNEDYKQSKFIKQSVQNNETHNFDLILDTIKKLFHDKNIQPMGQLMIIRVLCIIYYAKLCKDLIDTMNLEFVEQFEQKVLLELRPFAEFKMPSQDANRGATFFDRHSDPATIEKNLKTLGTSIVRLSLDCIQAWAQFFPQDLRLKNTPSMYLKFYQELVKKGVNFPAWAYYKEDYINEHKSHDYDRIVKLIVEQQKEPQNLIHTQPLEQTPGGPALKPMTPMDPQKIKTDALAVIQQCKELSKKTSVLCSRTLVIEYKKNLFHEIYDEAFAKHMEMDQIVNNLLEIDDEELATEIMGEMDELQVLIDDIKQYQQMQNYWPTFRKKYIKNLPDHAAQQQFEKEQLETAERERQRLEREKEQQRIKEQEEHERQQQLQESERQKREEQLKKQEQQKREEQWRIEEQQRRAEQDHQDKLEQQQKLLEQQHRHEEHQKQELLKQQNQVNHLQHQEPENQVQQQQADENSYKSAKFQQEPDVMDQYKSIIQSNIQAPQSLVNPNFQYSQKPMSNKQKRERSPFGIQKHQGDSHQAIPEFRPPEQYGVQSMAMKGEADNLQLNMNNDMVDLLKQQLAQKSQEYDRLSEEHLRLKNQSQTDKDKIEHYHQEIIRLTNQVSSIAAQHGQLNQQLSSSINNQEYDNLLQKLENERNNTRKAELKNNELRSTQDRLEIQIKALQDQLRNQQSSHDMFKQNLIGETQKSSQADASQLQKKITEHVIEKEQLKSQLDKNQDAQAKHAMTLQKLNQVTRELEEISKEKSKVAQVHNEAVDQHKFHVGEKQKIIDSLNDQLNVLKLKYEKLFKDYENLLDKHKKNKEELHSKVLDAKKECLQKQALVDQTQLQLSDKDDELKHVQIELNALHVEKTQLQRNNEAQGLQIKQYMNLLNNSNQSQQVKSIPLYQQKLQKALDDMDLLREQHKKEIAELSASKQQIIDDLALKNEQLQFLNQQSHKQQEVQQELVLAPPQQQAYMQPSAISNFESNIQNSQQVCPLPLFKHFPFNQHHNIPQYTEQQQELTLECLDMIFPYNDPLDYYNSKATKNRKGNVVSTSSFQIEIAHMDNLNKSLYRQRGLGSNGVLFQNNELRVGVLFQIQQKNSKQYFTYGIYLTSLSAQNIQVQFLETENIESFWAEPSQLRKQLKPQEQQLIEVIAGSTQEIVCQVTTQGHPYQFLIPNNICQLITYQDVKKAEFQQRWKQLLSQQQRTEILLLNKEVFQSVDQFIRMVPRLFIINSHKEQDYKMGIDELKIGGLGTCQYQPFWIKFELIPKDKICIYLTYESRYLKNKATYDKILQSYAQLLSDGKTK